MNLKLKRLVRTHSSEQYALFDLDQPDAENQPATIGKLDLHYTSEGMYGTLLLWDDSSRALNASARREFVHALLRDIAQPMGVPNEYVVEFFAPTLDLYEVFHNVGVGDGGDGASDANAGNEETGEQTEEEISGESSTAGNQDDEQDDDQDDDQDE